MRKKIVDYLIESLSNSMLLHYVNGSPAKRLFRIRELAIHLFNTMTESKKEEIYNKIKKNTKPPI